MGAYNAPINTRNHAVLRKRRGAIVSPYRMSGLVSLMRPVEGIVRRRDEQDDVRDEGCDLVHQDRLAGIFLAAGEGVDYDEETISRYEREDRQIRSRRR